MSFPQRIQPIYAKETVRIDPAAKPVSKSRFKRLFERSLLRVSSSDKLAERDRDGCGGADFEPSSVCLDKMVQNFMEDGSGDKPHGRSSCNCFHANLDSSSDDDLDLLTLDIPIPDFVEVLKGLVQCESVAERNLLADASTILEKTKTGKAKDDCRRIVSDGLRAVGYDAAICKSRWDRSPSYPAGKYEYIEVVFKGGERVLVDVEFRSEFEIARSTKRYRAVLQSLPLVFVGRDERLQRIVAVVSEAARQSLKKKGLHVPPWRNPDYMRAKWLAPYQRTTLTMTSGRDDGGGAELETMEETGRVFSTKIISDAGEKLSEVASQWQPPAVKPKASAQTDSKVVTGLASVLKA